MKGYKFNFDRVEKGFLYDPSQYVVHAETRGRAKALMFELIKYEDLVKDDGEKVTFLNMPIKRSKIYDKIEFEGKVMSKYCRSEILNKRERERKLQEVLDDDSIKYCFIRKRGSYYKPNSCGYTEFKVRAGVYTKEDAVISARGCYDISVVPIDIDEHNKEIQKEINELTERLLPL